MPIADVSFVARSRFDLVESESILDHAVPCRSSAEGPQAESAADQDCHWDVKLVSAPRPVRVFGVNRSIAAE